MYSEGFPELTHPAIVYGESMHTDRFAESDVSSQADEVQRQGMARKNSSHQNFIIGTVIFPVLTDYSGSSNRLVG